MRIVKLLILLSLNLYSYDIRSNQYDLISNTDLIPKIKCILVYKCVRNNHNVNWCIQVVDEIIAYQIDKEIKDAVKRSITK